MIRSRLTVCLFSFLAFSQTLPVDADDHLLTIGGGPHATNNQLSLERNVEYLQRVLARLQLGDIQHKILFSDGGDSQRDLQFEGDRNPEDLLSLLADIIGPSSGVNHDYRSSIIPVVEGTAEPATIEKTLEQYGAQLANGDRLIIYFTGHGGRPRGSNRPSGAGGSNRSRAATDNQNTSTETNSTASNPESAQSSEPEPTPVNSDKPEPESTENSASEDTPSPPAKEESSPAPKAEEREERPSGREAGGRGSRRESFANNILHLWNRTDLSVTEWTEKLDKLPADVPVIAVMVQCYSGGFGNFIFKGGNPANGLAEHPRAGFFSTVPDRVAAGCTPKVNEAEYREYSSYFFEALCGESRVGDSVIQPDYDQDGQTSFLEAHAYTSLTADTIDIPVRTTDIYLRQVSTTRGKEGLLTANSPVEELLAKANPSERVVVEGLSQRFELTGSDRAKEVDDAIKAKRDEKQKVDGQLRRHRQNVTTIKREIGNIVRNRWPEISSPWHPATARILTEESDALRDTIVKHERYAELKKESEEIQSLTDQNEQHELQIVKLERLKYWLETLALKANLTDEDKLAGLHKIVELESTFLTTKRDFAATTPPEA